MMCIHKQTTIRLFSTNLIINPSPQAKRNFKLEVLSAG